MSATDWKERVRNYQESKMTQAAWCRSQGIHPSTFQYHLTKARKQVEGKFIELKSFQGIKLRLGDIALELDPDFDETTLRRFLGVLRSLC